MIQDIHFLFVCPTFVLSPDGLLAAGKFRMKKSEEKNQTGCRPLTQLRLLPAALLVLLYLQTEMLKSRVGSLNTNRRVRSH